MNAALMVLLAAIAPLAAQTQVRVAPPPFRGRPPSQPIATGTSSIEGAVVDSVTHNPIRKATVNLNGPSSLFAVTDAEGRFAFRQLPAGEYLLQAQSERYPTAALSPYPGRQTTVSVAADEHKADIALSLVPGASLRGRIVDEEGNPMPQCTVSPMRYRAGDQNPSMVGGQSQSNEKGEYHVEDIPAGKYYLIARCFQTIPMPHAFVRREALAGVPRLTYPPIFYPASADLSGATRVSLTAGSDLSGIDFQMSPATGITLRGRVRPIATGGFMQVTLAPKNTRLRPFQQQGARANPSTGEFQIQAVRPGSYELIATTQGDGHPSLARISVEVGASAPEIIDVLLQPGPQIAGSVEIEGGSKEALKNLHVALFPIDTPPLGPQPQAEVQSDGSFVINASPGRWRLQMNGGPGYLKSVTLGDKEVSAASLEIGSTPGALKIVMSTKYSQVDVTALGVPADARQVFAMMWTPGGNDVQQSSLSNPRGSATFNLPPGHYFACAAGAQPFPLLQSLYIKKALESDCQAVEVPADSRPSFQVPFLPADEIQRVIDKMDADDTPVL